MKAKTVDSMGFYQFYKGTPPLSTLDLGQIPEIEAWLKKYNISNYRINTDGTINILGDLNLINKGLTELPDYIKFETVYGSFYGHNNNWQSLEGLPKDIRGNFELYAPWDPLYLTYKKFTRDEIIEKINIQGRFLI